MVQWMICIRAKILWFTQRHHRAEVKSVAVCFEHFECCAELNGQQSWNFTQHDFCGLKKLIELFGAGGGFSFEKGYCRTTISEVMKQAGTNLLHMNVQGSDSLFRMRSFQSNMEVKKTDMMARILPM